MKTNKTKLNFTKFQILNLNELSQIIGGVGVGDDDERTDKTTLLCKLNDPVDD